MAFFQNCSPFRTNDSQSVSAGATLRGPIEMSRLSSLSEPSGRLTLDDLWDGRAQFNPVAKVNFPWKDDAYLGSASQIVSVNGHWYALLRRQYQVNSTTCGGVRIDQVIMTSRDQGRSWQGPYQVAKADSQFCQYTDGSLHFDQELDRWTVLTQCLSQDGSTWNLCVIEKKGLSLASGSWTAHPKNPVVRSGDLWSRICRDSGRCSVAVHDEGTPHIISRKNGFFYFSFHGFLNPFGYRALVKTTDFTEFITTANDLPVGPLYAPADCESTVPGCIGGGHASVLTSPRFTYMLIEAPTKTLICEAGQSWTFVLARTQTLHQRSPVWSHFQGRSFLVNRLSSPIGCHVAYANLFVDNGETFLSFNFYSRDPSEWMPLAIYKLVPRNAPIQPFPGHTQLIEDLVVERAPEPQVRPPQCRLDGQLLEPGQTITAFRQREVPFGETCQFEVRTCRSDGSLSGAFPHGSCSPRTEASIAPGSSNPAPVEAQTIINPTVSWVSDPAGLNRTSHPGAAWLAFQGTFGDRYCDALRPGWKVDLQNSIGLTIQAFICNVGLDREGTGTGSLSCSDGISGSFHTGKVFSTIRCRAPTSN
jgi:hypothetical protein